MLHCTVVCFVFALAAALLGYGGIAALAGGFAKILFVLFAGMSVARYVLGLVRNREPAAIDGAPTTPFNHHP